MIAFEKIEEILQLTNAGVYSLNGNTSKKYLNNFTELGLH
jgi:hypothetical protein